MLNLALKRCLVHAGVCPLRIPFCKFKIVKAAGTHTHLEFWKLGNAFKLLNVTT